MICPQCGAAAPQADSRYCEQCGAPLVASAAPESAPRCAVHPDAVAQEICARCGAFACAACLRRSVEGKPLCARCHAPEESGRWRVPWEERERIGRFAAFFRTARQTMFSPGQVYPGMATDGRWWDPLSFVLFAHLFAAASLALVFVVIFGFVAIADADKGGSAAETFAIASGFGVFTIAVVVPIGAVFRVLVAAGVEHLLMMLFGGAPAGFTATFRAHCYSFGPAVIAAIPGCGVYVSETWQVVLRIFGYRGVHKISGGRAAAAVLVPIVVCCGGYAAVVFAMSMAELAAGK